MNPLFVKIHPYKGWEKYFDRISLTIKETYGKYPELIANLMHDRFFFKGTAISEIKVATYRLRSKLDEDAARWEKEIRDYLAAKDKGDYANSFGRSSPSIF